MDRRLLGGAVLAPTTSRPVCTTELGYMASIKPEFDKRNMKIIGLSVDPSTTTPSGRRHRGDPGHRAQLPDDRRRRLRGLQGLRDAARRRRRGPDERTPADNQTVRNVFVVGPDKKIKLILVYPMTTGRNFDEVLRVIDSLQLTANHKVATPVQVAAGRRRDHRRLGVRRAGEGDVPGRLGVAEAVHQDRAAAEGRAAGLAASAHSNSARRPSSSAVAGS